MSTCKGDSGGPLTIEGSDDKFYQLGIVHGMVSHCGNRNFPSIFARIDDPEIYDFITETVGKHVHSETQR